VSFGDIEVLDRFTEKRWRLSNLYYILNESNNEVKFVPNDIQLDFWDKLWYLNCISKGRQHGMTTFIDLFILDECLWHPNQVAGIIAHTLDDVRKIFRRKIKHPYDRLDEGIRAANPATNDSAQELVFKNNSEISVATTMRAGTLNFLHVSEFGYIAAYFPEKATEIVTGSFNTVHPGNYIFVESTGHGKGGAFYDLVQRSRKLRDSQRALTTLDFKYHFYPWWVNKKYRMTDEEAKLVVFTKEQSNYFAKVEKATGTTLDFNQRAWYVKKKEWNGELMLREYPSTDNEPFEASIKGAIFAEYMQKARAEGRISRVPYEPGLPVDTWWDIGRRDVNAIWFVQTLGREIRFIYYHEDVLKGLPHYLRLLDDLRREKGYNYRHHVGPNDFGLTEYGSDKTRFESARNMGYHFTVSRQFSEQDQIDAARNLIGYAYFDEENCDVGIRHLDNFRYEWNEHLQQYANTYRHDEASHASSALITGSMMFGFMQRGRPRALPVAEVRFPT